MVKEAMKTAEHHDPYDTVTAEAKRIAEMIRNSSHCVAFTGAGISTSAGYRSRNTNNLTTAFRTMRKIMFYSCLSIN